MYLNALWKLFISNFQIAFFKQKVNKNPLRIENSLHKNVRAAHKLSPTYNISVGIAEFRHFIERKNPFGQLIEDLFLSGDFTLGVT